jgi:hypothetical protein
VLAHLVSIAAGRSPVTRSTAVQGSVRARRRNPVCDTTSADALERPENLAPRILVEHTAGV